MTWERRSGGLLLQLSLEYLIAGEDSLEVPQEKVHISYFDLCLELYSMGERNSHSLYYYKETFWLGLIICISMVEIPVNSTQDFSFPSVPFPVLLSSIAQYLQAIFSLF